MGEGRNRRRSVKVSWSEYEDFIITEIRKGGNNRLLRCVSFGKMANGGGNINKLAFWVCVGG